MPLLQKTVILRFDAPLTKKQLAEIKGVGGRNPDAASETRDKNVSIAPDEERDLSAQIPSQPMRVTVETANLSARERSELARDPSVLSAPSMRFSAVSPFVAARSGQAPEVSWGISAIGAEGLSSTAGQGVKVAVLDTGIALQHPAFSGIQIETANFTGEPESDTDGHGTHIAGTIFGRDVEGARIGVARGVVQALIGKVLGADGGDTESVLRGIHWARDHGAHLICTSFGMDFNGHRDDLLQAGYHPKEATAIALSTYRENMRLFGELARVFAFSSSDQAPAFIAAAGNESERPRFTIDVAPPAAGLGFLSVGAVDPNLSPAFFSNAQSDIVAPGTAIWSADSKGGLCSLSGTSMAAAHMTGIAAALTEKLLREDQFSPAALRQALFENAGKSDDAGGEGDCGFVRLKTAAL